MKKRQPILSEPMSGRRDAAHRHHHLIAELNSLLEENILGKVSDIPPIERYPPGCPPLVWLFTTTEGDLQAYKHDLERWKSAQAAAEEAHHEHDKHREESQTYNTYDTYASTGARLIEGLPSQLGFTQLGFSQVHTEDHGEGDEYARRKSIFDEELTPTVQNHREEESVCSYAAQANRGDDADSFNEFESLPFSTTPEDDSSIAVEELLKRFAIDRSTAIARLDEYMKNNHPASLQHVFARQAKTVLNDQRLQILKNPPPTYIVFDDDAAELDDSTSHMHPPTIKGIHDSMWKVILKEELQ